MVAFDSGRMTEMLGFMMTFGARADVLTWSGARRYDAWEEERNVLEEEER